MIQPLSQESSLVKERATVVKTIESIKAWREVLENNSNRSLGFVPTMGALHKGHMSLIQRSIKENDITVCSIFVNPTQFNNPKDLTSYPITLDSDIKLLNQEGCDYVFLPNREMIYPDNYRYSINENIFSRELCGKNREGHFDGMLTVVLKLLNIITCDRAYFGEKDWQQYKLISGMVEALFIKTEVIPCKLIREDDGLAYSSRNKLLTKKNRSIAPKLFKTVSTGEKIEKMKSELTKLGFVVDYIEEIDNRVLVAAKLGEVRLIDNVKR